MDIATIVKFFAIWSFEFDSYIFHFSEINLQCRHEALFVRNKEWENPKKKREGAATNLFYVNLEEKWGKTTQKRIPILFISGVQISSDRTVFEP